MNHKINEKKVTLMELLAMLQILEEESKVIGNALVNGSAAVVTALMDFRDKKIDQITRDITSIKEEMRNGL